MADSASESVPNNSEIPLLPLRDVVVYPHMVIPLFVGREKSIQALEAAMADDKQILLVAQKDATQDDPGLDDMYRVGTVSNILQLLRLPDGTVKVLVEGIARVSLDEAYDEPDYFRAIVSAIQSRPVVEEESVALARTLRKEFEQYVN